VKHRCSGHYFAAFGRAAHAIVLALLVGCSGLPRTLETPSVRLLSLSLLDASSSSQRFGVRLLVENPNAFALPIENFDFEVRLAGEGLLIGRSIAEFTLPANGQEIVTAEITSDLVSSVSRLFALLQGPAGALAYELTGDLVLAGSLRPPLNFSSRGEAPLSTPGLRR
jgi:LEA14-like dessication related protein